MRPFDVPQLDSKLPALTSMSPAVLKATLQQQVPGSLPRQPLARGMSGALSEPLGASEVGSPAAGMLKAVFLRWVTSMVLGGGCCSGGPAAEARKTLAPRKPSRVLLQSHPPPIRLGVANGV
jgi:hypothetical protein